MAKCYDCGLDYEGNGWIEAVIPDKVWNDISPSGDQGGLLCITCIARRLVEKGYKRVPVWLCGIEPLRPIIGDPGDTEAALFLLREFPKGGYVWKPNYDIGEEIANRKEGE